MAFLLRVLNILMILGLGVVFLTAKGIIDFDGQNHLGLAIPYFIFAIFVQAFTMFYFIGVGRFTKNIYEIISTGQRLDELFEEVPENFKKYEEKVKKFFFDSETFKRQTIPWTMLMLTLGTIAFLLGGAHDTGLVAKHIHSGVSYGFAGASLIGFLRQWIYLGKAHLHLRKIKSLFMIDHNSM
jgi:hypothetical protein